MAKKRYEKKPRRDIYQEITDRILKLLDKGTVPWKNPIRRGNGNGWPKNLDSKNPYRGINVFLLGIRAWESGFGSDYWMTFRQAAKLGGQVRKGEKATMVTFWKLYEKDDKETGVKTTLPVLRHYSVFNADQCEGIEPPDTPLNAPDTIAFNPIEKAEQIRDRYQEGPTITHGGSKACYRPSTDTVLIAEMDRFNTPEDYYGTLFHELTHSTGISKRLDRGLDQVLPPPFGSPDYSKEELIAEMGATFLNAAAGISTETIEQSASYIDHWRKILKGDKRLVIQAAGAAQKAADRILGEEFFKAQKEDSEPTAKPPTPDSDSGPTQLEFF